METVSADHVAYLADDPDNPLSQPVEILRQCLLDIFQDRSDVEAIQISGDLIKYCRDKVLPALGGIRRNATANARVSMTVDEIASATGLSHAVVSRLFTERRGAR